MKYHHIVGSVQDYSISSALALEILQSCTKPLAYRVMMMAKQHQGVYINNWCETMVSPTLVHSRYHSFAPILWYTASTNWGPNETTAILQTILSNTFYFCMEIVLFGTIFYWHFYSKGSNQLHVSTGSDNSMAPIRFWTPKDALMDQLWVSFVISVVSILQKTEAWISPQLHTHLPLLTW